MKVLQLDRSGEYIDSEFTDNLIENRIVSQLIVPSIPPQNRVTERRNRILLDMVRSMMSYSTIPISFWGYILQTTVDILNIVLSKAILKTPLELWLSRPGLVFQRAATVIKYYYYFYSNFTSDFFLTCSNYTCISLVKHISTSVLLQLGNSHIWDSHKRLSVSNISSSNSGRTMRSPPQSYIYITITKQLCGINMVIL